MDKEKQFYFESLARANIFKSMGITLNNFEKELFDSFLLMSMKTRLTNFINLSVLLLKILKASKKSRILNYKKLKYIFIKQIWSFLLKNLLINLFLFRAMFSLIFN